MSRLSPLLGLATSRQAILARQRISGRSMSTLQALRAQQLGRTHTVRLGSRPSSSTAALAAPKLAADGKGTSNLHDRVWASCEFTKIVLGLAFTYQFWSPEGGGPYHRLAAYIPTWWSKNQWNDRSLWPSHAAERDFRRSLYSIINKSVLSSYENQIKYTAPEEVYLDRGVPTNWDKCQYVILYPKTPEEVSRIMEACNKNRTGRSMEILETQLIDAILCPAAIFINDLAEIDNYRDEVEIRGAAMFVMAPELQGILWEPQTEGRIARVRQPR